MVVKEDDGGTYVYDATKIHAVATVVADSYGAFDDIYNYFE